MPRAVQLLSTLLSGLAAPEPTLLALPVTMQVLVVSDMHRTESAMDPALFQYHQHFESPWQLVGKTSLSEVSWAEQGPASLATTTLLFCARLPRPRHLPATLTLNTSAPGLSQVFRVRHRTSGQVFAVKRSRQRFRSKLQRERCLREIRAVAALPTHPNIVVSGMGPTTWPHCSTHPGRETRPSC